MGKAPGGQEFRETHRDDRQADGGTHVARAENRDLQIELLYDVGVDDLQQRIQMLDDRAVVLFTVFIRDKNDVFLGYEQGLKLVCDQAPNFFKRPAWPRASAIKSFAGN